MIVSALLDTRTAGPVKTMQILLSAAVLLMALSVVADSDEAPTATQAPVAPQKLERLQKKVLTFMDRVGEKTRAAFHELHYSEFSNRTRNWFAETFQTLKEKFRTAFSGEESSGAP